MVRIDSTTPRLQKRRRAADSCSPEQRAPTPDAGRSIEARVDG
jgi:hypothetical protein